MKATGETLYWQSYGCGCSSPALLNQSDLPAKCPKHDLPYTQRYLSNKTRQSTEQIADNSKGETEKATVTV